MMDIIFTIFIVALTFSFTISSIILVQHKDEIWDEIKRRYIKED